MKKALVVLGILTLAWWATRSRLLAGAVLAATLGAVLMLSAMVGAAPSPTLTWAGKTPVTQDRVSFGLAAAGNGKIYYMGGVDDSGVESGAVQEYDPSTDAWTLKTPMPTTTRSNLGVAAGTNGKVYAMSGWSRDVGWVVGTVEGYDPGTDSWATGASIPTARQAFGAASATNGKIYTMGGTVYEPYTPLTTMEEYDPVADTWTARAPMPTARWSLAVVGAPNGKVYALGGYGLSGGLASGVYNPAGFLGTVEEYDPSSDTWTAKASMPTPRAYLTAVAAPDGKIYAIGGFSGPNRTDPSGYLATVEVYDPSTDTWSSGTDLSVARAGLGAAAVGETLYAIGGYTYTSTAVDAVEAASGAGAITSVEPTSWGVLKRGSPEKTEHRAR